MNILFICHEYPPARLVGGIGIFVRNISRSFVKEGNQVTVIGLYRQELSTDDVSEDGVRVVRIAAVKKLKLGWWFQRKVLAKKIKQLHDERKFDIVETSDFDAGFWLIPKLKIPYVVRLNGGEVYFRSLLKEPLRLQYRFSENSSLHKADAITSVSQYTWQETKRLFKLPDQVVPILPNPVDTSYFKPGNREIKKGCILYSGTFIRKKGVLELFKSLPAVFDQIEHAHLICVGADSRDATSNSPSTKAFALSLLDEKYHSRIQFTGRIDHSQVLTYIQQAHVCVYPSYLEAFPNAWIEAMACGKAVIGSNTGSGSEVIQDGTTGLLCYPADHEGLANRIINILKDDELRIRLGEKARQYTVDRLDISIITQLNLQWYNKVIVQYHNG
jgi:glycosyltransferase involved in cell wall biosynthesis